MPMDSIDMVFGLFPAVGFYAAFATWASLIVRALRGEDVKENWQTGLATIALITSYALKSGTQVREATAQRAATTDLRALAILAREEAQRRDRQETERAKLEDERQARLERLTKRLVLLASMTLAVALVALAVSLISLAS